MRSFSKDDQINFRSLPEIKLGFELAVAKLDAIGPPAFRGKTNKERLGNALMLWLASQGVSRLGETLGPYMDQLDGLLALDGPDGLIAGEEPEEPAPAARPKKRTRRN